MKIDRHGIDLETGFAVLLWIYVAGQLALIGLRIYYFYSETP